MATLCGLLLSMITLAYEVWQQKKQEKNRVSELQDKYGNEKISTGMNKGHVITVGSKQVPFEPVVHGGF